MSIFNKNSKKKLALALACASIFNGKILAMDKNKAQNSQTITAARNNTLENPKKSRFELARGIIEGLTGLIGMTFGLLGGISSVTDKEHRDEEHNGGICKTRFFVGSGVTVLSAACLVDACARIYSSVKKVDSKNKSWSAIKSRAC